MTTVKERSQEIRSCDQELVKNKVGYTYMHSQVLRIREEDSHLGEERLIAFAAKEMIRKALAEKLEAEGFVENPASTSVDAVLLSRPAILRCSPLSGKTTVKALH